MKSWSDSAPTALTLREMTMLLFSAKTSSIPVERIWTMFGDTFTAKGMLPA